MQIEHAFGGDLNDSGHVSVRLSAANPHVGGSEDDIGDKADAEQISPNRMLYDKTILTGKRRT